MWGFEIVVMASMIAFNSVFAAYEIALATVSLSRLNALAEGGSRGARAALHMKQNMEGSLAVIQLCITLVGVIAAATGGAGAEESIAPWLQSGLNLSPTAAELLALTLVVVPLTLATIVFGELVPKVFALRNKEWVCLRVSPAMRWFAFAARPVVWTLESAVWLLMKWGERHWQGRIDVRSEGAELQELRASAALARTSRLIGSQEERIIMAAASIPQRPLREIMLPAEHISLLWIGASLNDALISAHLDMHTRFPVAARAGDPQSIVGYVNVKDILAALRLSPNEPTLQSILRSIPDFGPDVPVARCLERLIREHTHIALVRGAGGAVLGMVTLEDLMEELVGEIEDEFDRLPAHAVASGNRWIVGGGISLARLKELTGIDLVSDRPERAKQLLNDWMSDELGRAVQLGEVMQRDGLRIVVRKVRRNKVQEAQLERTSS